MRTGYKTLAAAFAAMMLSGTAALGQMTQQPLQEGQRDALMELQSYGEPTDDDLVLKVTDGTPFGHYYMNGLSICVSCRKLKMYGKYYAVSVGFLNLTDSPVEFGPDNVGVTVTKGGSETELEVVPLDEYLAKVTRKQSGAMEVNAVAERSMASGNSYSTTTSYIDGKKVVSRTTTYDPTEAYIASQIAEERIRNYNSSLLSSRHMVEHDYLKTTSVEPDNTVAGYVLVPQKNGDVLTVSISSGDYVYRFPVYLTEASAAAAAAAKRQ